MLATSSERPVLLLEGLLYNRHKPAKGVLCPLLLQRRQRLIDLQRYFRWLTSLSKLLLLTLHLEAILSLSVTL